MFLYIVIDLVLRGLSIYMETNQEIALFIILSMLESLFKMPYRKLLEKFAVNKGLAYYQAQINRYSNLSAKSKESDTVSNFEDKLNRGFYATQSNWSWRIEILSEVFFGFYFMNIYGLIFYIAWYFLYIRYEIAKLTTIRKTIRTERKSKQDFLRFNFNKLHCDENNDCLTYKRDIEELGLQSYHQYTKINIMQKLPIFVSFLIVENYFAFKSIIHVVSSLSNYMNSYQQIKNDLDAVEEFFEGKETKVIVEQEKIDVLEFEGITMKKGDVILLKGPSGCGKTTWIKNLLLKFPQFHDDIVYHRQDIKEYIPFKFVKCPEKYKSIVGLNKDIAHSGGEKSRLCAALSLESLENRSLLILDEAENGLDADQAPGMITEVLEHSRDKIVIIVTHMCDCQMKKIKITKTVTFSISVIF